MNTEQILNRGLARISNDFCFLQLIGPISGETMLKQLKMFGFIFVMDGSLTVEISGHLHELNKGTMLYSALGSELRLIPGNNKVEGYFISFSSFFIESLKLHGLISEDKLFLDYVKCNPGDNVILRAKQIFSLMEDEVTNNKGLYSIEIIRNLVAVLFLNVMNEYYNNKPLIPTAGNAVKSFRVIRISDNFIKLVKQYSSEQRQVSFYAEKLCISPKYLYSIIKSTTGMTPNEWINDVVVNNAKHLLHKSENTIKEVSYALNFPNPSFFGKYFKRLVGISPADYQRTALVYSIQSAEKYTM